MPSAQHDEARQAGRERHTHTGIMTIDARRTIDHDLRGHVPASNRDGSSQGARRRIPGIGKRGLNIHHGCEVVVRDRSAMTLDDDRAAVRKHDTVHAAALFECW